MPTALVRLTATDLSPSNSADWLMGSRSQEVSPTLASAIGREAWHQWWCCPCELRRFQQCLPLSVTLSSQSEHVSSATTLHASRCCFTPSVTLGETHLPVNTRFLFTSSVLCGEHFAVNLHHRTFAWLRRHEPFVFVVPPRVAWSSTSGHDAAMLCAKN